MYIIIGVWGGKDRVYAAFKFFLYTLLGSVLMLLAFIALYYQTGTTDMIEMIDNNLPLNWQIWLWLAFFASFAVKMPMWPVHTWLPDAHVQAPTAGSVILAGVLLKMGGYGFLRFSLPILPDASAYFADMVFWLSVVAIIYTALVALVQEDMKKLIAYSSVAHMGIVTLGIFTFTQQGLSGALFTMPYSRMTRRTLSRSPTSALIDAIIASATDFAHSCASASLTSAPTLPYCRMPSAISCRPVPWPDRNSRLPTRTAAVRLGLG
jgi:NADH-quinone oxidoreductase subunit M